MKLLFVIWVPAENHMAESHPFFFGRKASISEKASALSLMESSISAMASTSSGLNLAAGWFSLHLTVEEKYCDVVVIMPT